MLTANHAPYVSKKALRKAIMKRSCLENIYFKKQDNYSLRASNHSLKNYCSRLFERKKTFFQKLKSEICF